MKLNVTEPPKTERKKAPPAVVLNPHNAPQPELLVVVPPVMVTLAGNADSKSTMEMAPATASKAAAIALELTICASELTLLSDAE
ncbi:hypothetical protein GCM10009121_14990 [Rhodanobacter soli]